MYFFERLLPLTSGRSKASRTACERATHSHGVVLLVALLLLVLQSPAAYAQYSADRSDARSSDKASNDKQDTKDFTIEFNFPLRYTSNVTSASFDSVLDKRPDFHSSPEFYLKWAHQYDFLKASADFGASIDRYRESKDADLDSIFSSFKLAMTDGSRESFVPYASVGQTVFFDPTFKQTAISYYDMAAGFYSGLAWRDRELIPYRDALIPFSDAYKPGDVSIKLDVKGGRRLSDQTDYQNTFVYGKIELSLYVAENWRVDLTPSIRARWYEDYFGEKRRDYRPGASVGVVWTPDWLTAISKRSELSMNIDYYRNHSNIQDKSYSIWEVGPTLSLRTKF